MKTILITGGASGIGKGLAMHYIKNGARVVVVGSTKPNGERFLRDAEQAGASGRASFIQADLGLVSENRTRMVEADPASAGFEPAPLGSADAA